MNLLEGLQRELKRNIELLQIYKTIPTGGFGALIIKNKIEEAEKAIAEGDIVKMLNCYEDLQTSK